MITKNNFLLIALFMNLSLFSMEQVPKSLTIDFKQYNFTPQEEESLQQFGIEKDNTNNGFNIRNSGNIFKISSGFNNGQQFECLSFNFKILERLPYHSPKIQHCVQKMYYKELCESQALNGRENTRHQDISCFLHNISFYAPKANNFNIETCIVSSESLNYAFFSTLVIMICGSGLSLLLCDRTIFDNALDTSLLSILLFLVYGFVTGK